MPRPGWPLIISSIVFIGSCLFVCGFVLAGFAHWDPCVWVVGFIFGGPSFVLPCWQYAATFRATQSAANKLRYLLTLMGVGGFLLAGVGLTNSIADGMMSTRDVLGFVLPPAMLSAWLCWVGTLNFRWYRELVKSESLGHHRGNAFTGAGRVRVSLAEMLGLIAALSALLAGASLGYRDIVPQVAMHVSPAEARLTLPAGASDVCIRRGSRGTIGFNFAIDEAGFWEWTKSESAGGSIESRQSGVKILPVNRSFDIYDFFAPLGVHTIKRGWFYDFRVEDRGHQYAYDADEGRVYYSFHAY